MFPTDNGYFNLLWGAVRGEPVTDARLAEIVADAPHTFVPGLYGLASQAYLCHVCGLTEADHA